MTTTITNFKNTLNQNLVDLRLQIIRHSYEETATQAIKNGVSYEEYLHDLILLEADQRWNKKRQRLLKASRLPLEKRWDNFIQERLPLKLRQQVNQLLTGDFLKQATNVLAFGIPGTGKSHLLCAIAQELVMKGHRLLFTTCALLVQDLLVAKKQLELAKQLKRLAKYEAIIIDDIGYVQQNRQEMEVLFTLLADRYEKSSIMLTSNLPFSKWEQIFKDPMTTAAAIDRLVHHSVIIELNMSSYRLESAKASILEKKE
ncbi:MAG: ATP-binding protein [Flavobacteriales bacterium]|nr:ATP-binding protein [Flavobacteriales bacterium]